MKSNELITKDKVVSKGVIWQARKKQMLTEEIFKNASEAKRRIKKMNSFNEIIQDPLTFDFILSACMLSKKSILHFTRDGLLSYISKNIEFSKLKEQNYLNELERYYLMTSGESIGGKLRNIIGQKGNEIFLDYILKFLTENNIQYTVIKKNDNYQSIETNDVVFLFNKKPKFIGKSVDFILLKKNTDGKYNIEDPNSYISIGELKSGIDPAGADEHWKTAATAIFRIHKCFESLNIKTPEVFFIGGAISRHMADEIINMINKRKISAAANLNYQNQMNEIIKNIFNY